MPPAGYFIDANLLVLLVAGAVDPGLIGKHRRLQGFTVDDYDLLLDIAGRADSIFVTPNTLTEASNLLAQHRDPERSILLDGLRLLIEDSREVVVRSVEASSHDAYARLGLTDAALLEVAASETPVLTADLELYLVALEKAPGAAVNFTHYRDS